MGNLFFQNITLMGLVGTTITSAVLSAISLRRSKRVEAEIKAHFDERLSIFRSTREWKEQALSDLFGPILMQFVRTKAAFSRWGGKNIFLEAQVVRQGNEIIRDLLLSKGHLIPPNLIPHASELIVHYDVWMELFDRERNKMNPSLEADFIFAGVEGFPFPREAEEAFKAEFVRLRNELFGA